MNIAQQLHIGWTSVSNPVGCIMNTAQHLHIHRGCNRPPKIPSYANRSITSKYLIDMLIRNKLLSPYLEEGAAEEGARAGR